MASQRQDVSPRLEEKDGWRNGWMERGRWVESGSYETSNFTWLVVAPRSCTRLLTADLTAECRGRAAAQATAHKPRRKKKKEIKTPLPPHTPPPTPLRSISLAHVGGETLAPGITPPRAQWHAKVNTHVLVPKGGAEAQVRYICAVAVNALVHTLPLRRRRRHRSITSSEMTVRAFNR